MGMKLRVERRWRSEKCTISDWYVDGKWFSYILEDKDRGLHSEMSLEEIQAIKVQDETAIPYGRYKVVPYYSPKHGRYVPMLLGVKGFTYVEIHPGNTEVDTRACLLPGFTITPSHDRVGNSRLAFDEFWPRYIESLKIQEHTSSILPENECWIEIVKYEEPKPNITT